jgi:squalene-hopene/tetraprenyl-beta-curcumene cyclase
VDLTPDRLRNAYTIARAALLAERTPDGHWIGELSTSALSTATAVSALACVQKATSALGRFDSLVERGIRWLVEHQNPDGGWGDTVRSFSNISTTMLCRAAFHLTGTAAAHAATLQRAEEWLAPRYGRTPEQLAEAIRRRYGQDRTFSVPILMTSALAGLVGWQEVPALPFELACFPQSWFRFLQLPVVSYALPALIAIGQSIFHHRSPGLLLSLLRRRAISPSLRVLQTIQPASGGFLEAAPLTSFVTLGLVSSGQADHPVVRKCVEFLVGGVRPDGSWPIDTNLSVWVTTLSVNALAAAGDLGSLEDPGPLYRWLIQQQVIERHPYTGADPGGWGWSYLSGSVPDADDTPGALLALHNLSQLPVLDPLPGVDLGHTVGPGLRWLLDLQNRDGGWPTFCRGWGKLAFDRSGVDLTAHVLRAMHRWKRIVGPDHGAFLGRVNRARNRGLAYLKRMQRPDGSWLPLWFGNQHTPEEINPTYGTSRVLAAYRDLNTMNLAPARRGTHWLLSTQNSDGGWGGARATPSSMEETALAVEALLGFLPHLTVGARLSVNKGLHWLVQQVESGRLFDPAPIGFYFAKLWYYEALYPIIFTVAALGRALHDSTRAP